MELVTNSPINPNDVYRLIDSSNAGSVVFHFAVVRGATDGKKSGSIEFQPAKDSDDVIRELRLISDEIRNKWKIDDVLTMRATGKLNVGDVMSLIAVSSPHRDDVFNACSFGLEKLKQMKSIIKKETFG